MSEAIKQIGFAEGRSAELHALRRVSGEGERLIADVWRDGWRRIVLAGIGASYAALATPLYQLRAAGFDAYRSDCSDLPVVADPRPDLLLAVSQSGRSRETTDAAQRFADRRVATVAITNSESSPLRSAVESCVTLGGAPDSRVSTVGFVTTFTALGMLTDLITTGEVDPGWSDLAATIERATESARETIRAFATDHLADGAVDVVASAAQLTSAEAIALLFREGPLVASTAYGTRGYLHGPMDIAGGPVSHILIGGERELQLARQLQEKTDSVLIVTDESTPTPFGVPTVTVPAGLTPSQRALVEICVLQELVAAAATVRGNSVDDTVFTRQDTKIDDLTELRLD
ncbi:sugar isomerase [Leifsonia sp. Root227]|uniref:SIS domain-containing protein n=1 Tax=Leifsonia sp. Root227 TaxID=1736496 RepID=UPI0006F9C7E4|nr:SIS domain-containing protein [Leifsonia sp. Root227]KRC47087.1 sugar isomerase [Leifsonia sp. Root227]